MRKINKGSMIVTVIGLSILTVSATVWTMIELITHLVTHDPFKWISLVTAIVMFIKLVLSMLVFMNEKR